MKHRRQSIDTAVIHAGQIRPRIGRAVVPPIFRTSIYEYTGETSYDGQGYSRLNTTPNHRTLHARLAALENAEAALVAGSGMAAITTGILTVCKSGDHLLMLDSPYGGTRAIATDDLPRLGVEVTFIDGNDPASWLARLRPNTKGIYVESISNPLMKVPDLEAAVGFARQHGLVSMIDSTFATPVNFRPAEIGFDLIFHSATKYLNGHTDLIAGAIIGRRELVEKVHHRLNHLGGMLDPESCSLLERGIKTLALRVRRQNESALKIAQFLSGHPRIERVNYPGLPHNIGHAIAAALFDGFGGMLSFEIAGGHAAALRFIGRLTIPVNAVSLGGVESLVILPAVTAYASTPKAEREALGITDGLVRMSVGIEDPAELLDDIRQALES